MGTGARAAVVLGAILAASGAWGQSTDEPWRFSASVSYYDVPNAQDFWSPIVTADRGSLHLEARYNYLAQDEGSLWVGANFGAGSSWDFDATMMLGVVFGSLEGIAPGYELSLSRGWFSLSGEGEYLFSTRAETDNYFYTWTEATGSPASWCRLGVALQRTLVYPTNDGVQRGIVAAFSYKKFEFEVDVLDPNRTDETYILSLSASF